jgi:serine/threonine protein kinase
MALPPLLISHTAAQSAIQLRGDKGRLSAEQLVSKTTCGTWLYTAPEVHNHVPYSPKVDQFAYAMILYELLQGAPPFRAYTAEEATVQLALGHRPEFRDGLNDELCRLVRRCWAHEPCERPSFAEALAVLEAVLEDLQPCDFEEQPIKLPRASLAPKPGASNPSSPQCSCVLS